MTLLLQLAFKNKRLKGLGDESIHISIKLWQEEELTSQRTSDVQPVVLARSRDRVPKQQLVALGPVLDEEYAQRVVERGDPGHVDHLVQQRLGRRRRRRGRVREHERRPRQRLSVHPVGGGGHRQPRRCHW